MANCRTRLWQTILVVSFLGFCYSAFADGSGAPPVPQSLQLAMLWPLVGVLLSTVQGYAIPKIAAEYTFFHTAWGAVVIGLIGAVIGSIIPIFQAGTVTWVSLAWAAISGATAFFARLNPSTTKDDPPVKSPASKLGASMVIPVAFLLSIFGSMASGCATPAGKALKQCELGKLGSEAQVGMATAQEIAMNPGSTAADLETAALTLLPGQLECGAQALLVWLESLAAPDAGPNANVQQALVAAHTDVTHDHAKQVLRAYLAKHPATACGARAFL